MADAPQQENRRQSGEASIEPADSALLAPYSETRPGFELLTGTSEHFPSVAENRYQVCHWDIWATDDPTERDAVRQRLNAMQMALGSLDDEARFVRLQIACLQRCWWEFPTNVDVVLRGIGSGTVNLDGRVSCEPPWSELCTRLRLLRNHPAGDAGRYQTAEQEYGLLTDRRAQARHYMTILDWWTFGGDLELVQQALPEGAAAADRIYRWLGPPTPLKALYVQKVRVSLGWHAFPSKSSAIPSKSITETLMTAIGSALPEDGSDVGSMIERRDLCHHAFFRHVDGQLAAIGAGARVAMPGAGEERRRIHEAVTNYVHGLCSWLAGRPIEDAAAVWPPSDSTVRLIYTALGEPTPVKRWLAACLWKHLQDNQAQHGRGALDSEPERFEFPEGAPDPNRTEGATASRSAPLQRGPIALPGG